MHFVVASNCSRTYDFSRKLKIFPDLKFCRKTLNFVESYCLWGLTGGETFLGVAKQNISLSERISDKQYIFIFYKVSYIASEYCCP